MPRSVRTASEPGTKIHYAVELADLQAHLYRVTLTLAQPTQAQRVSLPVWIPGSYLVREFSRHLQKLQARQSGKPCAIRQLDKCTWELDASPLQPVEVCYEIYAHDLSVRGAWLDAHRGFFNGTSLFLRVHGQEQQGHGLTLRPCTQTSGWSVATGLSPQRVDRCGFGEYLAQSYDELVDAPVELGSFWRGHFTAAGIEHEFVVSGAPPALDGERLLTDARKICETAIEFWHGSARPRRRDHQPPFSRYVFMLHATDDGYGGLEHRNSTALICARRDLPRTGATQGAHDGYTTLLGLISHEYFHSWNVKRLRPSEFSAYDYTQENYTALLWFFEGFTSYYDDLLLCRAGLLDAAGYLKLLNKTINQVLQTPGRKVQSVAQASLDAWIKYYRPDENTPNATVSYYTKGALVALSLDLTLRREGHTTLDAVMRDLWHRCQGGPMTQADLQAALEALGGRSYAPELNRWVHGTGELPLRPLLAAHGVTVKEEPAPLAQQLGLRVEESAHSGLVVKTVLRGGAAEKAGMAAGDEWLGVEVGAAKDTSAWRLHKLDDLQLYAGGQSRVKALVARDKRLLKLPLSISTRVNTWRLTIQNRDAVQRWLGG